MKAQTTIRAFITLPENSARIQRLYDDGRVFRLEEERIEGIYTLITFVDGLRAQGGKIVQSWDYIDDEDGKKHEAVVYELVLTYEVEAP